MSIDPENCVDVDDSFHLQKKAKKVIIMKL